MITHYGLFWSARDVFWGSPSIRGELLGRVRTPLGRKGAPTRRERAAAKDFRDYVGLYCLYGDGELLYIGEAGLGNNRDLFKRLRSHRKGPMAGRWDRFSWFGRSSSSGQSNTEDSMRQLEAISIAITNPGFNKQSGTFAGAEQVFQVPHEAAEGDLETKLDRIAKKIEELSSE